MKLTATNLACQRGGRSVFKDVSFAVSAGECLLLTGPNGAGKSSLLRMIAGLVAPAAGTLELEGKDAELSIGHCCHFIGHTNAVKPALSVRDNLAFWSRFLGGEATPDLAPFGLEAHGAIPANLLSQGQSRRLALLRLTAVRRPLWLLDEPTVGIDAASQATLVERMSEHLDDGGMIVAATHIDIGIEAAATLDLAPSRSAA